MPNLRGIGSKIEDQVASYLLSEGYTLLMRRFHARFGEIDLIALDEEVLVFVEVKYRKRGVYIPEEAVDKKKIQKILFAAEEYLAKFSEKDQRVIRFDVVAVAGQQIRHYKDAFRAQ